MYGRVTNVLRRSTVAAPRLSASLATKTAFAATTTAPPTPKKNKLMAVVQDEAELAQQAEVDIPVARGVKLRELKSGTPVRPHELSFESRVPSRPYAKRPTVAPTTNQAKSKDIFYQLSVDPLSVATNASILGGYVTEMGQIRPRTQTGLTVKTQRKLGKAIRRARMMGVLPLLSKPTSPSHRR